MKKIIIIVGILFLSMATASAFNFIKGKNMGFRFEDYKTKEEAKAALLKLHPVGSPVDGLLETLRKAGATIEVDMILTEKNKFLFLKAPLNAVGASGYYYNQSGLLPALSSYKWAGGIPYDKDRNIIDIGVGKEYMGL
jgi:hypothetical protein